MYDIQISQIAAVFGSIVDSFIPLPGAARTRIGRCDLEVVDAGR
jgi:hypothetical protein